MFKINKRLLALALSAVWASTSFAQLTDHAVAKNPMKDNWYLLAGLDMSLQAPYGYDFADVFPNGKTFGINAGFGKWITPELGLRAKVNWENGIKLFENHHANWLAPFDEPGVNMDKGGYVAMIGDIQFDIHNIICGYDADRKWNLQVYPRAGLAYNFGAEKGTPVLGIGIGNTYRLNDKYVLFADVDYHLLSSGFVACVKNTGDGSNANGFLDINVGVQFNIGNSKFKNIKK